MSETGLNEPFRGTCPGCGRNRILTIDDPRRGGLALCTDCLITARKVRDGRDATPDCPTCSGKGWFDGTGRAAGSVVTCHCAGDRRIRDALTAARPATGGTRICAMRAEQLRKSLEKTTLPPWVITGIRQVAWDQGHSCGQAEVDNYVLEWLSVFEELQGNAAKGGRDYGEGA